MSTPLRCALNVSPNFFCSYVAMTADTESHEQSHITKANVEPNKHPDAKTNE